MFKTINCWICAEKKRSSTIKTWKSAELVMLVAQFSGILKKVLLKPHRSLLLWENPWNRAKIIGFEPGFDFEVTCTAPEANFGKSLKTDVQDTGLPQIPRFWGPKTSSQENGMTITSWKLPCHYVATVKNIPESTKCVLAPPTGTQTHTHYIFLKPARRCASFGGIIIMIGCLCVEISGIDGFFSW